MAHPYGNVYRERRLAVIGQPCVWCGAQADTADHVPPLSHFDDPEDWEGELLPACKQCNYSNRADRALRSARRVPGAKGPQTGRHLWREILNE